MNINLDMALKTQLIETTLHFFLHYRMYSTIRTEHLDDMYTVASSLTNYPEEKLLTFSCMDQNILVLRQTNQF